METALLAGSVVFMATILIVLVGVTFLISYLAYRPWRKKKKGLGVLWGVIAFAGCCFGIIPGILAIGASYMASCID